MAKSVAQVADKLAQLAPTETAEDWDQVGLLVGDPRWETEGAIVSIDLTQAAIDAAKASGFKLIVNHHPCIFSKLNKVVPHPKGGMSNLIFQAIQEGIAVVSAHTNFDQCALEVVQAVSDGLGVKPVGRLVDQGRGSLSKLVCFVPETHVEKVREAITEAGAGRFGNYSKCTFSSPGEGQFLASNDAHPFLGKSGELEKVKEIRLETIFPRGFEQKILRAMRENHPYEEVAFDVYPIVQGPAKKGIHSGIGYGFFGDFPESRPFKDVAESVKHLFQVEGFLVTDPQPQTVKRIAFVAGKGASFVNAAARAGCDLFITGEAGYHVALAGSMQKVAVVELGHRESELFYLKTMTKWLQTLGLKTELLNVKTQRIWCG